VIEFSEEGTKKRRPISRRKMNATFRRLKKKRADPNRGQRGGECEGRGDAKKHPEFGEEKDEWVQLFQLRSKGISSDSRGVTKLECRYVKVKT